MNQRRKRPGLFDLQVNGFAGVDFQQSDLARAALRRAVLAVRRHHVHRMLLTLITDEIDELCRRFARIEAHRAVDPTIAETIPGYHLEGPFLSASPGYCGAHPPRLMRAPSRKDFDLLNEAAGGRIKLITLAPEWKGSAEFISHVSRAGVVVSLGHTQATEAQIDVAIAAGATLCTHLGNAVPAILPRHDNVMQRLLARDELTACMIPDGLHLPPYVLKNFFRAKPRGKVILTSDCMAAAGARPGRFTIGKMTVTVGADRVVREPGKPNFSGSALTLDDGVGNAVRWLGVPRDEAWAMASTAVAKIFGLKLPTVEVSE